jgi:hypothetical protein
MDVRIHMCDLIYLPWGRSPRNIESGHGVRVFGLECSTNALYRGVGGGCANSLFAGCNHIQHSVSGNVSKLCQSLDIQRIKSACQIQEVRLGHVSFISDEYIGWCCKFQTSDLLLFGGLDSGFQSPSPF